MDLRRSQNAHDVATFVAQFAQENLCEFTSDMKDIFGKHVTVRAKENIPRIAEKIEEIMV
jgi:hypothetical protein